MNRDENQSKGLQKDVALGSSLEELKYKNSMHQNPIQDSFQQEKVASRIRDTIDQHRIQPSIGSIPLENSEELQDNLGEEENQKNEMNVSIEEDNDSKGKLNDFHKTIPQRILEFLGFVPVSIAGNPTLSYIVIGFMVSMFAIILLVVITTIGSGRGNAGRKEINTYLAYGILDDQSGTTSLVEYLQQGGWCDRKIDCIHTPGYKFFTTFRKKILEITEEYQELNEKNNCTNELMINENLTSLLAGTIFYNRADDEILSSGDSNILKSIHYEEEMDYIIGALFTEETPEMENSCYVISSESYKDAIVGANGYIDRFRSDLGKSLSYELKLQIYEEMLSEINYFMGNSSISQGSYIECSGVTVVDGSNIIGTYSLEDYVAGVLSGEMYKDFPMESQKALAVAARTYVLAHTNSCKKPIESSSDRQNFNPNIQNFAREAANATAGQILVNHSGNIFSAEYDSWNCKGSNTCTYEKKPNGEIHQVTISDKYLNRAAGGHGRGMSQIAAADMADRGMHYDDILKFFYSDGVQLSNLTTMSGSMHGSRYTSTAPLYSSVDALWGNQFYNPYAANVGQCVWYARNRAQEILYYSNMSDELKNRSINSIKNTLGNGEAWFRNPDGNLFEKSTNVNQPRAGAIVSWSGGVNRCTPNCGHVAIIESVNSDGTVTISEGWKDGDWSSTAWSTVRYRKFNATIDYIKYHTNSNGQPYYFNGYVYLLG